MTSQKSLKNKVNAKDFLRSLAGSLLFPAIALIVLIAGVTGPVIAEIVSPEHKAQMANAVSYFLSDSSMFYYMTNMLQAGMVICGMLTAVKQFYFVMSKKQVNVYLSLGISRIRLFVNRAVSALISLFASVLIPMLLIYIVNIAAFGMSSHLTGVFLYSTFMLFISALAGFAVGAFAVALSGNVFEAGLTCATVSLFGYILPDLLREMSAALLKGYVYSYGNHRWTGLLSPFTFVMDLGATRINSSIDTYYDPIGSQMGLLVRDVSPDKYKIPEELAFDAGFILPLFIVSLLSAAVMVLAAVLFKKRRAEHANSLGHFKISAFINSAFVFTVAVFFLNEMLSGYNRGVMFVLMVVSIAIVPLLAYFIIQLILTRKIKASLRSLIPGAVLSVLAVLCVITLHTGVFGLYNKTPDKADIKNVAISVAEHPVFQKDVSVYDEENIFYSGNSADIDMVLSVFDKIKNDDYRDNYFGMITVALQYNNGKVKYRSFPVYTEETYESYMKAVYESNYFDEILKDMILGKSETGGYGYYDGGYSYYDPYDPYLTRYFRDRLWYYLDSDSLMDMETEIVIEPSEDMLNALYTDLSKMSYEQLFKNGERPLGLLTYEITMPLQAEDIVKKMDIDSYYWYDEDYEEYKGLMLGDSAIYLYPEMTETLKFLTDGQYEVSSEKREVKEILYTDSKIQLTEVISQYKKAQESAPVGWDYYYDYSSYLFDRSNGYYTMLSDNLEFYVPKDIKALDLLKDVYTVGEHPLVSVTEQSKIDSIMKASVPFYLTIGDNGRYAYAVYDDGTILPYYIPQSNLDALK